MASTSVGNLGHPHPAETFWRAPNFVNSQDLGASSAVSITLPSAGVRYCRISANLDLYVKFGSTGVSTAAASDGTASILIPLQSGGRTFDIASTLATTAASIMSTAASHASIEWWTA